jgi:Glycosyl transferase family 2
LALDKESLLHIVRMMAVHNEADVLQRSIDWYADAGFPAAVVDNESTDESHEICRTALQDGKIQALGRLETGGVRRLFTPVLELAGELGPEYVMLTAADEFFEVADGGDLRAALVAALRHFAQATPRVPLIDRSQRPSPTVPKPAMGSAAHPPYAALLAPPLDRRGRAQTGARRSSA